MTTLKAVETPLDPDRADVIVLHAPGKPGRKEHPSMGPFPKAINWLSAMRQLQGQGYTFYQADDILLNGYPEHGTHRDKRG